MQYPLEYPNFTADCLTHCRVLAQSYEHLLGVPLVPGDESLSDEVLARRLYDAPFPILSHNTDESPRFCFANRQAQSLFGYGWEEMLGMESRFSAPPMQRDEREALLQEARKKGFVDHYHGIRIAKNGTRFHIEDTVLWNLTDSDGKPIGQAARIGNTREIIQSARLR